MQAIDLKLYGITDNHWTGVRTLSEQVEEALEHGVTCLQYREKKLSPDKAFEQAKEIQSICKAHRVPFIMNDDVELALRLGADGVHVGQKDMEVRKARKLLGNDKILGVSARTVEQARFAQEQGADYLGVGAVFGTNTKEDAKKLPYSSLCEICKSVTIPVVAIGGITYDNIDELAGSGISGVAVISAIFGQKDIGMAAKALKEKVEKICKG